MAKRIPTNDKPPRPPRARGTVSARIRAALAYADIEDPEVMRTFSIGSSTVSRWKGSSGGATPDAKQMAQLEDMCGVPPGFIEHGFGQESTAGEEPANRELRRIVRRLDVLEGVAARASDPHGDPVVERLTALESQLRDLEADAVARDAEAHAQLEEVLTAIRRLQPQPPQSGRGGPPR